MEQLGLPASASNLSRRVFDRGQDVASVNISEEGNLVFVGAQKVKAPFEQSTWTWRIFLLHLPTSAWNPAQDPASDPNVTMQARCTHGAAQQRLAAPSSCRTGTAWRAARAWCCASSATTSRIPSSSAQARLQLKLIG